MYKYFKKLTSIRWRRRLRYGLLPQILPCQLSINPPLLNQMLRNRFLMTGGLLYPEKRISPRVQIQNHAHLIHHHPAVLATKFHKVEARCKYKLSVNNPRHGRSTNGPLGVRSARLVESLLLIASWISLHQNNLLMVRSLPTSLDLKFNPMLIDGVKP